MHWVSTGLSLVVLCVSIVLAWLAMRSATECKDAEDALRRSVGRIAGNEAEIATLTAQVHKLRGKIYSLNAPAQEIEIARSFTSGIVCENWKTAQRDGPRSEAASCECDYCVAKRAEREALRSQLVPKTSQERRDAIEKGRH